MPEQGYLLFPIMALTEMITGILILFNFKILDLIWNMTQRINRMRNGE